mgnify:CR=1 FL=1
MPLTEPELTVGAVAYFDHEILLREPEIDRNDDGLNRPGPFLCIEAREGRSVWVAITSQFRPERLLIDQAWRIAGSQKWRDEDAYLVDGLNTYVGPDSAFVRAASAERPFYPNTRPHVSLAGVQAVIQEVDRQGGPRLD